ncbi:MAG: hypothetical protein GEV06_23710 [Luteitalea sp.]|nr:hypothetical protein [Luteitalea sp.]
MTPTYPLLFSYRDLVFGNGYVAEVVATNGRALVEEEDGAIWFEGVNPGGMAASGRSPDEAHAAFRERFRHVLADLASEAETFDAFRREVARFFDETNEPAERDWLAAVEAVRAGEVRAEGLPQKPAASPRSVRVLMRHSFTARDNDPEFEQALAA